MTFLNYEVLGLNFNNLLLRDMSSVHPVIGQWSKFNKVNQSSCSILSSGQCVQPSLFEILAPFLPLSRLEMEVFTMKILTSLLVIALMISVAVPAKVHHENKDGKKNVSGFSTA